jgi:hypothetical protein
VAITAVVYNISTFEERRHTLQIGVWIGVHGQRVPGPIVILSVLDGRVLMAFRHQWVHFIYVVVI